MKSYKDLDKDIILNAPEGAMWVFDYPHQESGWYYKVDGEVLWKLDGEEDLTWVESSNSLDVGNWVEDLIPLPNVEIPWEATEDSKCPVPTGSQCQITLSDGRVDTCEGYSSHRHDWALNTQNPITSYKIIDKDYLPSEQEEDIVSYKLPLYTSAEPLPRGNPLVELTTWPTNQEVQEKALIKRLEFLQNLANKFPEIRDEAIKFMSCELDGYMNTLWEKDNDE